MTQQEIFDKVAAHLLQQNRRAEGNGGGFCAYRGDHGLKCAIGCLIPDERYLPEMEGRGASQIFYDFPYLAKAMGVDYKRDGALLRELQRIHDWQPVRFWRDRLNAVARSCELKELPADPA